MLMIPRRKNEFDLLEDMFKIDPFFSEEGTKVMKTDIKEQEKKFIITIDLPGYDKEDIKIHMEEGYLNIHAKTNTEKEENENGKFLRKERYFGECSRSFYIGENITEEDIKATFKNGILNLEIPKKEEVKQVPEKKYIEISE